MRIRKFVRVLLLALLFTSAWIGFPAVSLAQPQQAQDPKSQTVYVTRTGKKYHTASCRYLASSKIPMPLKDAKAKGFTACKLCHPPE